MGVQFGLTCSDPNVLARGNFTLPATLLLVAYIIREGLAAVHSNNP